MLFARSEEHTSELQSRPHIAEAFLAPYLLVELVGREEGVRVADEEGEDAIFHVGDRKSVV